MSDQELIEHLHDRLLQATRDGKMKWVSDPKLLHQGGMVYAEGQWVLNIWPGRVETLGRVRSQNDQGSMTTVSVRYFDVVMMEAQVPGRSLIEMAHQHVLTSERAYEILIGRVLP